MFGTALSTRAAATVDSHGQTTISAQGNEIAVWPCNTTATVVIVTSNQLTGLVYTMLVQPQILQRQLCSTLGVGMGGGRRPCSPATFYNFSVIIRFLPYIQFF